MEVLMPRYNLCFWTALCAVFLSFSVSAAQQAQLLIPWPPGWEYQPPNVVNGVWYVQARRANNASELLRLTIVKAPESSQPITDESLRSLVVDLAALSKSDVRAFPTDSGYYFVALNTMRASNARQFAEGVLLRDGYLIRMTLYADNLESNACADILAAIAQATVSTTEMRN